MATGSDRPALRLYVAPDARRRLAEAVGAIREAPAGAETLIVAATRGAADDLARAAAKGRPASFGWHRFSLLQLASSLARYTLASSGRLPGSPLGADAIAARAVFGALAGGRLDYFTPVARTPGFAPSVARTLAELRLAGAGTALASLDAPGPDLASLLKENDRELAAVGAVDLAALLSTAIDALDRDAPSARLVAGRPVVIVDPVATSVMEARFIAALAARSGSLLVTLPEGDAATRRALGRVATVAEVSPEGPDETTLGRLRAGLFTTGASAIDAGEDVQIFSAPGEAREAVEIARRVHGEAERGVPFDEMAILVRAPGQYLGLLEHALARAGVPAWFSRGTRRPDPAGRALLALLHSAEEGVSARRFAEYLSLAQVPDPDADPGAIVGPALPSEDDALSAFIGAETPEDDAPDVTRQAVPPESPVVEGSLRAPWKWEALLVESAVIGGRDRWVSRLDGLDREYRQRLAELGSEEPEAPRAAALRRDIAHLAHLRAFALPVVAVLDEWRTASLTWGEWLDHLGAFAPRVLRRPSRVLRVLAELRPLADVGPVGIGEVRKVLSERLRTLALEPPARRFGRVFVGSPDQARGRTFRVVFVPGLAERVFPQKLREDPLLLDDLRARVDAGLPTRNDRAVQERLQLRLAVGAASERLHLSYPRLDVAEARPRVPSFYALDVLRALTGQIPSHDALEREAYERGSATLAWPAPADPRRAIDPLEHDLAVLRGLLDEPDPARRRGRARYLLALNPCLGRSVRERYARHHSHWSDADGLLKATGPIREALTLERLGARPYSLSALQHYAACPYRFLLAAIYRLAPREDAIAIQRLDPLTRGSIFHRIQSEFLRGLRDAGQVPIRPSTLPAALQALSATVARVAREERARLAPAIPRVWDDEMSVMERDLARWVQDLAGDTEGWVPHWFELGFGLPADAARDPASIPDPVLVDDRFLLRGSIDLVERHPVGAFRVTDHKTGRARHATPLVVAGGEVLQPVLYSLVVEAMTGGLVNEGRLSYCTTAGSFTTVPVLITATSRRMGLEVLEVVDRAVELGVLAPYPRKDACRWCDFRMVCGPHEQRRTQRKDPGRFPDLDALRGLE